MFEIIIGTMLVSGIVGGLINSYLSDPATEKPLTWWQHIVVGVGASFMVPVFLNMISSRLISEITGPPLTSEMLSKILVLAGFCLLASISSRAFIRSITDKLLQEVSAAKQEAQEAKQQAEKAETIASLSVESDPQEQPNIAGALIPSPRPDLSEPEKQVLRAMVNSRFAMRSITGIAQDTGRAREEVNSILSGLIGKALVADGMNIQGQLRWYPTPLGREATNET